MKKTLKLTAFALMLALLLTLLPATAFAEGTQQTLTDFVVTNANLNLQPGQVTDLDAFFTAAVPEDAGYKIDCEFWRYWGDGKGVVYFYNLPEVNEENKQDEYPCYFDTFEAGKAYWYSVVLTPKDPDNLPLETDPDKIRLTVNGKRIPSRQIVVGEDKVMGRQILIFNIGTITVSIPTGNEVTDFVLDGAILDNLPAGEITDLSAIFAGSVPEDAAYELFLEYWMDPDGKAITNSPAYNTQFEKNGKLLTAFEIGKTYRYSVAFTSKNQERDVLTKDCSSARLTLNGTPVDLSGEYCVETDALGQSVLFHNIRSYTVRDPNEITDFAVENATLTLQPGATPIDDPGKLFTGKVPDGAAYILEWELWYCIEDHTSFTSSRPGNEERRALNMLLTSFEPGKTYVYYVRLALRDGEGIHLPANQRDIRLTLNGQLVDKRYVTMDSFAQCVYGNEPVSITLPAQSGGGNPSFIEPDCYPDDSENEDVAPAAAPAPATPGRDESDTAPKTADAPILPTLLLTAFAALALTVSAKKRLCK